MRSPRMFGCPRCGVRLANAPSPGRVEFACTRCRGRMLGAALVRQLTDARTFGGLWMRAGTATSNLDCPACCGAMGEVQVDADSGPLVIDICRRCHVFWLDRGESQSLERVAPGPPVEVDRALLRPSDLTPIDVASDDSIDLGVTNPWRRLAHHLGAPLSHDQARVWLPLTTMALTLALLVGIVISVTVPQIDDRLGFIPADPFRLFGLPVLVAPFLQEGLTSGLLNLLFFVFLADNLEQFLGSARLFLLVALAALAATLGHAMMSQQPEVPLVGTDAIVTALSVTFGLSFYRIHLDFLLGLHRPWHLFSVPVWAVIALWTMVTVADMVAGVTSQTLAAHFCAAAIGVAAKWTFHDRGPAP